MSFAVVERALAHSYTTESASGVQAFAEEDAAEAVLLGPVGLGVPVPGVVRQVLGHRLVGVEPYLGQAKAAGAFFGEGQQPGADAAALSGGQHGHVLQQQVTGL